MSSHGVKPIRTYGKKSSSRARVFARSMWVEEDALKPLQQHNTTPSIFDLPEETVTTTNDDDDELHRAFDKLSVKDGKENINIIDAENRRVRNLHDFVRYYFRAFNMVVRDGTNQRVILRNIFLTLTALVTTLVTPNSMIQSALGKERSGRSPLRKYRYQKRTKRRFT